MFSILPLLHYYLILFFSVETTELANRVNMDGNISCSVNEGILSHLQPPKEGTEAGGEQTPGMVRRMSS